MHTCTAIVERCRDTGFYVGYVPGFPGAHSQGDTLEELNDNLGEVIAMLLDDGEPMMEGEYVGTQTGRRDLQTPAHNQASSPRSGAISRRKSRTGRHHTPSIRSRSRPR